MDKKKVIVFAFKSLFPDRTDQAFYQSLELAFDVTFYGPGYVDIDLLEENLEKVCDSLGPFDAAFVHKDIICYQNFFLGKHMFKFNDGVTRFLFDKKQLMIKKPKFGVGYDRLPCISFMVSMLFDYYTFSSWYEEHWGGFPGYLLMPPPQIVSKLEDLPDLNREKFYELCNDGYYNFCSTYNSKIIPLAHMVSANEFVLNDVSEKERRVAVPGVLYAQRKAVLSILKKNNIQTLNKTFPHKLISMLFKMRLIKYNYKSFENFFRQSFIDLIYKSLITYTEGSRLRMFLKKYIEIPTYGSLLMCEPFNQAEHFGFIDKQNCIYVNNENIVDVTEELLNDIELTELISLNGQKMVYETHSSNALAPYFKNIVELAINNDLKSVAWKDGKMQLNSYSNQCGGSINIS